MLHPIRVIVLATRNHPSNSKNHPIRGRQNGHGAGCIETMSKFQKSVGSRGYGRSAWRSLALLSTAAVLVSACGFGNESTGAPETSQTTAVVAVGNENSIIVPKDVMSGGVCYSWPSGTTDAQPCAVGLKGPGGGRIFYDAGSDQPWGRFLEVAPQAWGGTLVDCKTCGAATESPYFVTKKTSDGGVNAKGHYPCRANATSVLLPGEAGDTLWEIGGGRRNTEVLSKTSNCVDGTTSALTLATGYRGGGLSDWYLPSGGELTELCKYTGRNAIGGFSAAKYASSTVGPMSDFTGDYTNFFQVKFYDNPLCERIIGTNAATGDIAGTTSASWELGYVRPIRAFR